MSKANLAIVHADTSAVFTAIKDTAKAIKGAADGLAIVNEKIKTLRGLGVTSLGDMRKDTNARTFHDAFVAEGVSKATAKNYVSDVRFALENDVPFVFNAARAKAKGKGDTKKAGEAKSDYEKMIAALLNVWKMSDTAEEVLIMIETLMADGTPLIDAIAEVLKEAGEDLSE
jgi:hypothetical protein